ncbi:uncharacterized protein K452DRAFT_322628 [Aplosporella prunicola CBS 121167]|uniref:Uncharacterized protein n=1 Tax=Aplosporella prunicola CBS 121167 TaxID=1176127 RepID=A0A6A6B086_9PEZI|nr:uncharacterized protein K452DRAFT_322628 [Aplosporella prunicola CBS 121167]KAF2136121.1 hypothetical protein K452DRAFT_322628 [Aplosporella prunicola CBS 121167]
MEMTRTQACIHIISKSSFLVHCDLRYTANHISYTIRQKKLIPALGQHLYQPPSLLKRHPLYIRKRQNHIRIFDEEHLHHQHRHNTAEARVLAEAEGQ